MDENTPLMRRAGFGRLHSDEGDGKINVLHPNVSNFDTWTGAPESCGRMRVYRATGGRIHQGWASMSNAFSNFSVRI